MNYQEELIRQKNKFQLQLTTTNDSQAYYEMLIHFTDEMIGLTQQIEQLKKDFSVRRQLKEYEHQWFDIMDELQESLQILELENLNSAKGKKLYETVDEIVADLEDWIESVNEYLEDKEPLSYIEAWDIGVFF